MNIKEYRQILIMAMEHINKGETVEDVRKYLHSKGVKATVAQVNQFKLQVQSNLVKF